MDGETCIFDSMYNEVSYNPSTCMRGRSDDMYIFVFVLEFERVVGRCRDCIPSVCI